MPKHPTNQPTNEELPIDHFKEWQNIIIKSLNDMVVKNLKKEKLLKTHQCETCLILSAPPKKNTQGRVAVE